MAAIPLKKQATPRKRMPAKEKVPRVTKAAPKRPTARAPAAKKTARGKAVHAGVTGVKKEHADPPLAAVKLEILVVSISDEEGGGLDSRKTATDEADHKEAEHIVKPEPAEERLPMDHTARPEEAAPTQSANPAAATTPSTSSTVKGTCGPRAAPGVEARGRTPTTPSPCSRSTEGPKPQTRAKQASNEEVDRQRHEMEEAVDVGGAHPSRWHGLGKAASRTLSPRLVSTIVATVLAQMPERKDTSRSPRSRRTRQDTTLEDQAFKEIKIAVDGARQTHSHAKERKAETIGDPSIPTKRTRRGRRTPS